MSEKEQTYSEGNRFFIFGEFNDKMLDGVLPELSKQIDRQSRLKDGEIVFDIRSNGGRIYVLHSILFSIKEAKKANIKIITNVIGGAASCGSMLAIVGDERNIYQDSEHYCHFGRSGSYETHPTESDRFHKRIKKHWARNKKHYLNHTNAEFEKIFDDLFQHEGGYLDAKECIKYGLADNII